MPPFWTCDDPDGDRPHRERDDQRLDLEPVADVAGDRAEDAGPDNREQHARRRTGGDTRSSAVTVSAPATMKPETPRSKPPIRISSVWPPEASPTSAASTRIDLMLVQVPSPGSVMAP